MNGHSSNDLEELEEDDDSDSSSPPLPYLQAPPPDGCCTLDGISHTRKNLVCNFKNTAFFIRGQNLLIWMIYKYEAYCWRWSYHICQDLILMSLLSSLYKLNITSVSSSPLLRFLPGWQGPSPCLHSNRAHRSPSRLWAGRRQVPQHPWAHPRVCCGPPLFAWWEWEKCTFRSVCSQSLT